jgi:Tfp pilus assembly protein PilO
MTVTKNKTLLIAVIAAAAAAAAFWFLALSPKREEAATLEGQIATKQAELETAEQTLAGYKTSKANYGKNYASMVRLGKAVPEDDDVRSLLVQLDAEAGGTHVDFRTIQIGGSGAPSAAAADAAGTTTGAAPPPGAVAVGSAGFSAMPFGFSFRGNFENLSQFFARMERFVTLRNEKLNVTGRLLRLESIALQVDQKGVPEIRAQIGASTYLVPEAQGQTPGATPQGPAVTPAATTAGGPAVPTTTATVTGATR